MHWIDPDFLPDTKGCVSASSSIRTAKSTG
jgi:hypothetical protein